MMLVPLALGLVFGAAAPRAASLSVPPALIAPAPDSARSGPRRPGWTRLPAAPATAALVPTRFSRRTSTTRVERGASFLGARGTLAPRTAWAPLHRLPGRRTTTRHLAASEGRGPPIAG